MERRNFLKNIGMGSMVLPFAPAFTNFEKNIFGIGKNAIRPKALKPGDTIGIVSPSSAIFQTEPYEIAVESMQAMGLKVKLGAYVKNRYGHLAGRDEERAQEFNDMFTDPSVNAVIALRGGSGAARIVDKLDYEVIAANPKIFIGYSDITALHMAIYEKTGLVTFHGPLATSTWNSFAVDHFKRLLFDKEALFLQNPSEKGGLLTQVKNRTRTMTPGKASGQLLGGNLSVLTGIMGSEYFPSDWNNKILYLEDVGEAIYAVDRMMSQLQLGGVLDSISGFVFGKCTDCDPGRGYGSLTMEEVLDHYIKPLGIPAFSGTMIGHINDNFTIPNGVEAEIDADNGTIRLKTPAVT